MTTSNGAPLDWRTVFRVVRIFKSFRLAMGLLLPGALLLAMLWGYGVALDSLWSLWSDPVATTAIDDSVAPGAVNATAETPRQARLTAAANLIRETQTSHASLNWLWTDLKTQRVNPHFCFALDSIWTQLRKPPAPQDVMTILAKAKADENDTGDLLAQADAAFAAEIALAEELIAGDTLPHIRTAAAARIKQQFPQVAQQEELYEQFEDDFDAAISSVRLALVHRHNSYARARELAEGVGAFEAMFSYERGALYQAIRQACQLNLFGDFGSVFSANSGPLKPTAGALLHLARGLRGVKWFVVCNPGFATLYLFGALVMWSLVGGAMHRMAAVRLCTGQKLSFLAALSFARDHFWSYLTAPLTPVLALAVLAALVALLGLVGSIPYAGPILVALFLVVAIVVGFAAALALVGLGFGAGLMYPAIAVEGTDRFDAVSRSFGYVYSQPWRLALYGLVSLLYGALGYLFVRGMAWLALLAAHTMLKLGAIGGGTMGPGSDWVDSVWPVPGFWNLHEFNFAATGIWGDVAGAILSLSVYLVIAIVGGFLIAFVVSATTVMYTMLRNAIDGAPFTDVYIESEDETETLALTPSEELLARESQADSAEAQTE